MQDCFERLKTLVMQESPENRATLVNEFLANHPECAQEFTLQEIGELLGLTRERIRQIEASAMKKLRHPKIGKLLKAIMESSS